MKFCLDDGALLVEGPTPTSRSSAEATLHIPGPTRYSPGGPTSPPSTMTSIGFQPPAGGVGSQYPTESTGSRKGALLWIVLAVILGGSGIAIALIITRGRDGNSSGVANSNLISSPTPGQNTTDSSSSSNTESNALAKSENTSPTNRQAQKPTPPATTDSDSVKPPKVEPKEPAPTPKPAPRGPVSGGVLNGKAVRLVQPTYPAIARAAHASGTVTVQVLVDEAGNVISASAVSGHPLLQQSAVAAARASKFSPTLLSGVPVKVSGVITYNFQAQ